MTWVTGTPRMPARSATLTTAGSSIGPACPARAAVAAADSAARRSKASSWPRRPPRDWPGRFAGRERPDIGRGIVAPLFSGRRAGDGLRGATQPLGIFVQGLEIFLPNRFDLQRTWQDAAFEGGLPTCRVMAQVGAAT